MTESGWQNRIVRSEIYHYLGIRTPDVDESLRDLVETDLTRLIRTARVRTFSQTFPLEWAGDGEMRIGSLSIRSDSLSRNLQGCDRAALFGVTLGVEVDRLIYRLSHSAVGESVITDACGGAAVEAVCSELCEDLRREAAADGRRIRPRFSPGYGDFSLDYQTALFEMLQLTKRIGVSLTEGGMMTPTKSVTAVVGMAPDEPQSTERRTKR